MDNVKQIENDAIRNFVERVEWRVSELGDSWEKAVRMELAVLAAEEEMEEV